MGRDPEPHHLLYSTVEEILPELESGGIKDLVQVIQERFTSSLVSHGDNLYKARHLHDNDPELYTMLFSYSTPVSGLNPIPSRKHSQTPSKIPSVRELHHQSNCSWSLQPL